MMRFMGTVLGMLATVQAQDTCMSNPCMNGALCQDTGRGYTCLCNEGFTGSNCQLEMDIHFAIDPMPQPVVGMGQDEHGCYADGGYQWCENLSECVREWETPCPDSVISMPNTPNIPYNCATWFDGCNQCQVTNGQLQICTMMMCFTQSEPECLNYHRLSEGDVCYRYCEDGSEVNVDLRENCPDGTVCSAPATLGFDTCGSSAWTCLASH